MSDDTAALVLALATENEQLRTALAEAQELLIETAVDAGEMHARLEEVQQELAVARAELDAWQQERSLAGNQLNRHPCTTLNLVPKS